MTDTNSDEGRDPVRKILKSLPQIQASEHLERRLSRIKAESETSAQPVRGRFLVRKYVPVYAFSVLALVGAAAVVYMLTPPSVTPDRALPEGERRGVATAKDSSGKPPVATSVPSPTIATRPETVGNKTVRSLPSRISREEELERQGLLREVGGTGVRPALPPTAPFLQSQPDTPRGVWRDSMERADSTRKDSLRRPPDHR